MEKTIQGLNHIGIFVTDLERSKQFYTNVLDFELMHENSVNEDSRSIKLAFVRNENVMIELIESPASSKNSDGVIAHIAFNVENIEDAVAELCRRGVTFQNGITHIKTLWSNGYQYILFRGPDNEVLELGQAL